MSKNPRDMWRPKLPEMPVQCTSCPFRKGNDKESGKICSRLNGGEPVSKARVAGARFKIKIETSQFGDFSCHQSVYNDDMTIKPYREQKQCPGASAHFKKCGEK